MMMRDSSPNEAIDLHGATAISRRRLFRVGTGFIAALAAVSTPKSVLAYTCGTPCCDLRTCNRCAPNVGCGGGWVCPSGYQASWWICYYNGGSRYCTCGECTISTDCHDFYWSTCSYSGCP